VTPEELREAFQPHIDFLKRLNEHARINIERSKQGKKWLYFKG